MFFFFNLSIDKTKIRIYNIGEQEFGGDAMITNLHIKNIGIIEDLSISLEEGFNILTGETGSGKTLIIQAINIIKGGRFSKEMIRKGEEFSFVEANIFCPQSEIAMDGNIIISREIHQNGKNLCKINGRMVTVNELKTCMSQIIDIHGQHDNQELLDNTKYIDYLDNFIGEELYIIKNRYIDLYKEYNLVKEQLKQNYGDDKERERKLDLLQYQLTEIDNANLKVGEEEKLEEEHNIMKNAEKLKENIAIVDDNFNMQVIDGIANSVRALEKVENCGEAYQEKLTQLKDMYYEAQEFARDIYALKEEMFFDEYERDMVEKRLDEIFSLKRKYGNSIEEILKYKEELEEQINNIQNLEEINRKLLIKKGELEEKMKNECNKMNQLRQKYSDKLSAKINKELQDLEMYQAKFEVKIAETEKFTEKGLDQIDFMICTNKGEESKELNKIASGGEMSRIMLAIKTVLADVDKTLIMIFDEIDTGISGKAAKVVGDKMKHLSEKHQVICITHLASIAAKGEHNYYISKITKEQKTITQIQKLTEEETIKEIARIANGEVTNIAIENARELRKVS